MSTPGASIVDTGDKQGMDRVQRVSALLELDLAQAPLPLEYAEKFAESLEASKRLSRVTLAFSHPFIEGEFLAHHHDSTLWRSRLALAIASAVYLLWGLSDIFSKQSHLAAIISLRFSLVAVALLTSGYGFLGGQRASAALYSMAVSFTVLCALSFTVIISYLQENSFPKMETTGFVIVLASAVVVLRLRFAHGAVVTNVFILGWVGTALGVGFGKNIPDARDVGEEEGLATDLVTRTLVVIVAHVIFLLALYETEATMRKQYIRDMMLRCEFAFTKAENANLRDLLDTIRDEKDGKGQVDLAAPAEKMIDKLESIKERKRVSRQDTVDLEWMVGLLRSNAEIYAPDIKEATSGRIDSEMSQWLVNSVSGRGAANRRKSVLPPMPKLAEIVDAANDDGTGATARKLGHRSTSQALISTPQDPEIVASMRSWEFDIRLLEKARPDTGLQFVTQHALTDLGITEDDSVRVDWSKLSPFLDAVCKGYHPEVPYHNAFHGADVVQATYFMLSEGKLAESFEPLEILTMIIGGAVHDLDHPGLNNNFEIATRSDRALLYNDVSPLENHHVSRTFFLMRDEALDVFGPLPKSDWLRARQCMIDIVLATDLKAHFAIVAQLKALLSAGFDRSKPEDRLMMAKAVVKCADVSNPTRGTAIMDLWTDRFVEETYAQGDREKALGLPVSAFMDRNSTSVPKLELGFVDYLVRPLYTQVDAFAKSKGKVNEIFVQLERNYATWKKRFDDEEAAKAKQPPAPPTK